MKAIFSIFHHVYQRDGKVKQEAESPVFLNFDQKDRLEVAISPSEVGKRFVVKKSDREGIDVEMELRPEKDFEDRISKAFNEFEENLRPHIVTDTIAGWKVTGVRRSNYTDVLQEIERKYKIEQGDPDFLEWFLTCIGRSPRILEDEE